MVSNQKEAFMATTSNGQMTSYEKRVTRSLREYGTTSFEELPRLAGLDWVTVFSIVDRLARTGSVVLTKHGLEYRVALENRT